MFTAQTTRSPLTAIQSEYTRSASGSTAGWSSTFLSTQNGSSNGSQSTGETIYKYTDHHSRSTVLWNGTGTAATDYTTTTFKTTEAGGGTTNRTTDASGGVTNSYTTSDTTEYDVTPTVPNTSFGVSDSGVTAGATTFTELLDGLSTSTNTHQAGIVSGTFSETYTYPESTVATSTETTTQTAGTAVSELTTVYGSTTTTTAGSSTFTQTTSDYGFITDTRLAQSYASITCSARFEVIETAFWLDDSERAWVFTGGAGVQPLHSICSEASVSFTTGAATTTSARTRTVVVTSDRITISRFETTNSSATVSWTTSASASATITDLTISDIPNSTSTSYGAVSPATTTQSTALILRGSFTTNSTNTETAYASETYAQVAYIYDSRVSVIPAFDGNGDATGFVTRSSQTSQYLLSTSGVSGVAVAFSGSTGAAAEAQGISETITVQLTWNGISLDNGRGVSLLAPRTPRGVRVYASSDQDSIFAQIGASGLGFTIPFTKFSRFQRGSVSGPLDTTYTTTDASAGNTRSYTVSIGTSATSNTARFISITRATVSTTQSVTSASFYNTIELTRRSRALSSNTSTRYILGGRQFDTRSEFAALHAGVIDSTIVESTTTHNGVLTTHSSYTAAADSSFLIAFKTIPGYSESLSGPGYSTSPKWVS
ncbi:hypothetical protein LBMAG57_30420 [Verrucomicrobiota bacterium]|nr:hypothetical protein LBMAG57_30420 [Verrucomicrobiota bacterium]